MRLGKALITGAGNGIGRAVAIKLSQMGYELILTSRRKETLEETAKLCQTTCTILPADLKKPEEVKKLAENIKNSNQLDVIFYSHGIHLRGIFLESPLESMDDSLQLYLTSILTLDHHLLPILKQSQSKASKAIIYMGSVSSTQAMPNNGTYAMCKHALKAHADSLFEEIRESGIKVSTLFPGYINSREHTHANLDPNKMIQVDDIVLAVEFLLKVSQATCVTSINLRPQLSPKLS